MSLRTAVPATQNAAARAWLSRAALVAGLSLASCTDPRPEVIARFPADASSDTALGAAGANDADSAPPTVPAQRGRVKVIDGNLVTDRGTPLRGLVLDVDTTWSLSNYDFDIITTIAQTTGLNTLHVYLEDTEEDSGSRLATADAIVSLAAQAGLYGILAHGTGKDVGLFDAGKIQSFWATYAARYASSTHVLYEIQNNPETTCAQPVQAATLTMEAAAYAQIRAAAPDSHIVLFSTTSLVQPNVLTAAVTSLGNKVDWSNASFGMDVVNDCLALANLGDLTSAAKSANVPLLIGQLPKTGWGPYIIAFEQQKLGWMQFEWFGDDSQLTNYASTTTSQGALWCPEQGTFPENSATCQ